VAQNHDRKRCLTCADRLNRSECLVSLECLNYYNGVIVEDCVEKMLAFKQRCPAVTFELAPNEFAASIPGCERFWALSLCRLMERLEKWEREQITGA
jgi:hypothetical protein